MLLTILITTLLVSLVVLIHFEALQLLSKMMHTHRIRPRFGLLFGEFGAMLAHVIGISTFSLGYLILARMDEFGSIEGAFQSGLRDCWYFHP
jgi:hypothetical protein